MFFLSIYKQLHFKNLRCLSKYRVCNSKLFLTFFLKINRSTISCRDVRWFAAKSLHRIIVRLTSSTQPQDKVLRAFPRFLHYHVGIHMMKREEEGKFGIRDANPRVASRSLHRTSWRLKFSSRSAVERELSRGKARRFAAWRLPAVGLSAGFSRNYSSGENCRRCAARAISSLSASPGTLARFTLLLNVSSRIFFFRPRRQKP